MPRAGERWRDPCFECGQHTHDQIATTTRIVGKRKRITLCGRCATRRHAQFAERAERRGDPDIPTVYPRRGKRGMNDGG
jgi:hypothetical protein